MNIRLILKRLIIKVIKDDQVVDKLLNGSFWVSLSGILSKVVSLVGAILLARIFGVEHYGKWGVLISTIMSFSMFAGAGMGLTATKYIAYYKSLKGGQREVGDIISLVLVISVIFGTFFSFILFFSSTYISNNLFNDNTLALPIKLISFSLLFLSINGAVQGIFLGHQSFKTTSLLNIIFGVINYPLIVLFAYYEGLKGGAAGYSISVFAHSLLMLSIVYKEFYYKKKYFHLGWINLLIKYKRILLNYSFPAIFGGALVAPVLWLADIIVVNSSGGFEKLGFFQAGNRIKELIIFVPSILSTMIVPILSSLVEKTDLFKDVVKFNLILNLLISILISIPLIVFSSFIMSLFGKEFVSHNLIIVLMCIASIMITYNSVVGKVIASNGNMWLGFLFNFIWGVILISLTYLLVRVYNLGGEGYAMSFLLSYLIHSIIQTVYIKKYRKKNENRNSYDMV